VVRCRGYSFLSKLYCKITSCMARSQDVLQDHKLYCKITSCIARSQVVLQDHKLYCKITGCIARSQVELQDHKFLVARLTLLSCTWLHPMFPINQEAND